MGEAPSLSSLARTSLFLLLLVFPLRVQLSDGEAGKAAKGVRQVAAEKAASPGSAGKIGWRKVTLSHRLPQPLSISLGPPASFCPVPRRRLGPIVHSPVEWPFWLGTMELVPQYIRKASASFVPPHPVNLGAAENGSLSGIGGGFWGGKWRFLAFCWFGRVYLGCP